MIPPELPIVVPQNPPPSAGATRSPLVGTLMLLAGTTAWGSTYVVVKDTQDAIGPAAMVFGRFLIAGILFLPFMRQGIRHWRAGLELGFWLWAGYATQAVGLQYTTVPRSAFITTIFVIFVPILSALEGKRVRALVWIAAAVALAGTGLLSFDGGNPNWGDAWALGTAAVWGVYIHRIGAYAQRIPAMPLAAVHIWGVVLFAAVSTVAARHPVGTIPWLALIYLGVVASALTTLLQSAGQQSVPAPQAAIIFTLEPVFASILAFFVNGTRLGGGGWIGAILILLAAVLSQAPTLFADRAIKVQTLQPAVKRR
jgi:drug/metabolite transporter (DMT)-like permease